MEIPAWLFVWTKEMVGSHLVSRSLDSSNVGRLLFLFLFPVIFLRGNHVKRIWWYRRNAADGGAGGGATGAHNGSHHVVAGDIEHPV